MKNFRVLSTFSYVGTFRVTDSKLAIDDKRFNYQFFVFEVPSKHNKQTNLLNSTKTQEKQTLGIKKQKNGE